MAAIPAITRASNGRFDSGVVSAGVVGEGVEGVTVEAGLDVSITDLDPILFIVRVCVLLQLLL